MTNNSSGTILNIRKKFHSTHELITTSYHEAGHTIYGLLKCIKVEEVSVFENKKTKRIEGFTYYKSPTPGQFASSELNNYWIIAEISCKYAGLNAEKYHFKNISGSDKFPMFLRDGSSSDTLSAAAMIRQFNLSSPGRKTYNYKKKLIKNTCDDLQEHWDAITLISHALFKKRRLDYEEIKKILIRKSSHKQFWKEKFKDISKIYEIPSIINEFDLRLILAI